MLILDSKTIEYKQVDITQPDHEDAKELMRSKAKAPREGQPPVTPQIFYDDEYCGVIIVFFSFSSNLSIVSTF